MIVVSALVMTLLAPEDLAVVVQTLDSAIHRITIYPVDSAIGFPNTYPLDSAIQRLNNRGQMLHPGWYPVSFR